MWKVILQNFLTQKVDQGLDIFCHLLFCLRFFKRTEVNVRKCALEELDVELVTEKDRNVVNLILDAQIAEHLVAQFQNRLDD